jgi:hypothetical protein
LTTEWPSNKVFSNRKKTKVIGSKRKQKKCEHPSGLLSTLRKGENAVARCPHSDKALGDGPFGRIAFSHADLSGAMDHRNVLSNRPEQ